jgi:erythromycin esterase
MKSLHPLASRLLLLAPLLALPSCDDGVSPGKEEALSWVQAHAVPLNDADPESPEPALSILQQTVGDARIVGLGEGTHGTTEFWGIRQKISRYLVEEMGFTAILMEAGLPNSLPLDAYVTRGEGSAGEAHQRLGTWRYQEMRDLIDWMREFNLQNQAQGRTLRFFGYDCAFHDWEEATEQVTGFLEISDPAAVSEVEGRLENYTKEDADWVQAYFQTHAQELMAAGGEDEYRLVLRVVQNLAPNWTVWYNLRNGLPDLGIRDSVNLENFNWIVNDLLDGGKVVVWAHNGHVGNTILEDQGTDAVMLGARLKEQYGSDYQVMATEFHGGQFLAWDRCEGHPYEFVTHTAAVPLEDTYAHRFHMEGIPLFYLDLGGVDASSEESGWLMGPLRMRFIGASYCSMNDREWYSRMVSLPQEYDGVIFFDDTHPATPISF